MGEHTDKKFRQIEDEELDFGTFLKVVRTSRHIRQGTISALLQDNGWTPTTYTRLENGDIAPRFADLLPLYRAFVFAGVSFSLADRQHFVERARTKIESKKTHREQHSDAEWAELRYELARLDGLPEAPHALPAQVHIPHKPLLADTEHLIGRESWREGVLACFNGSSRTKVVVIQGPAGIGKSSELNWLATWFFRQTPTTHRVILCDLRSLDCLSRPEEAFHVFVGTLLMELGSTHPQAPFASLEEQTRLVLEQVEKARVPLVVFLDHAECLLHTSGELAPCWERFLMHLLRGQHGMTLVLASQEWPGWYHGERQFVSEHRVPPLPRDKSILVLQRQGLDGVPIALLEHVHEQVKGVPIALEWVATLAKQPLGADDWNELDSTSQPRLDAGEPSLIQAIERLLAEPHIFGGALSDDIAPLLQRIIASQHLSAEARTLLEILSVATIPLAKPALQMLCPQGPRPIKELRRASVLVSYPDRIQLLPMVAAAMYRNLTPEQRQEREVTLIEACSAWVKQGSLHEQEQSAVITELATLLLKHHRLVEAAEHLIYYGWISFNQGHGQRLARLVETVLHEFDWRETPTTQSGGFLLHYYLISYLGLAENEQERTEDHQQILNYILAGQVALKPLIEVHLVHTILRYYLSKDHFEQAQQLIDACFCRMGVLLATDFELHAMLLSKQAWIFGKWSGSVEEQRHGDEAKRLLTCSIEKYQQCISLLQAGVQEATLSPLRKGTLKKKLAMFSNNLSYQLNRMGRFEEALVMVERGIELKEQGFADFGALAASYGEKSQILAALGQFQEALRFDEKARAEVQRCANTGDRMSQEEVWIYRVNQGRLYLRLGSLDEAEQLLLKALPHIHARRKIYRMFVKEALMEIGHIRNSSHPHQLDWRWVQRYRELDAYDAYWWWAQAGSFTEEEQRQWDQLFSCDLDEQTKNRLSLLLAHSRDREVETALAEGREPRLCYPTIDIEEVQRRIAGFLQLDREIQQHEPNAIVRRLYHGTIEDELCFIRAIEATHQGNSERFWELTRQINPPTTHEEMQFALLRVKQMVWQGLQHAETKEISERVMQVLQDQFHLSLNLSSEDEGAPFIPLEGTPTSSENTRLLSVQAVRRFFETALQEAGFDGWRVVLDPHAQGARIDSAMKLVFLQNSSMSLEEVRDCFLHELLGHVLRSAAGERSALGLLGINTKGYMATEEGLAQYYERTAAAQRGEAFDDSITWFGGLAVGLASGVVTLPQTFSSLFAFFEPFILLYRLLWHYDKDRVTAERRAHHRAMTRCLRTFRGVPDLTRAGICYPKDVVYLRGRLKMERAIVEDETVLDRLAVGKVALELLPDLQELGITTPMHPLRKRATDPDLDAYIWSFQAAEEPNT